MHRCHYRSQIKCSTKVHLVFKHLEEACMSYGCALLDENAAESVNANFDTISLKHYQGYIVKDINLPKFAERLSHAVKTYNSSHV